MRHEVGHNARVVFAPDLVIKTSCWDPTCDLSSKLLSIFSPRTALIESQEDCVRCHPSKVQARLRCLMSAIVSGNELLVAKGLGKMRFLGDRDLAGLCDPTQPGPESLCPLFAVMAAAFRL